MTQAAGLPLEKTPPARQSVAVSPSFGQPLTDLGLISQALATFVSRAAEKLRWDQLVAGALTVLLHTSRYAPTSQQHDAVATVALPEPTSDTAALVKRALRVLEQLRRPGFRYHKTGVLLTDLRGTDEPAQLSLFGAEAGEALQTVGEPDPKRAALLATVDALNRRYGRGRVSLAVTGVSAPVWKARAVNHSPRFTTRWEELPRVGS